MLDSRSLVFIQLDHIPVNLVTRLVHIQPDTWLDIVGVFQGTQ